MAIYGFNSNTNDLFISVCKHPVVEIFHFSFSTSGKETITCCEHESQCNVYTFQKNIGTYRPLVHPLSNTYKLIGYNKCHFYFLSKNIVNTYLSLGSYIQLPNFLLKVNIYDFWGCCFQHTIDQPPRVTFVAAAKSKNFVKMSKALKKLTSSHLILLCVNNG